MEIVISNTSKKPIYEQITDQLKQHIIYEDLERAGFIESIVGKGSFVTQHNKELLKEEKQRQIEEHFTRAIELSKQCGISYEDLAEILKLLYTEEE